MRRRDFIALVGSTAAVWPLAARAQQQANVRLVGFLVSDTPVQAAVRVQALRDGLREFGYVEGRNIALETRYAEFNYDRLPALVSNLVALNVDVLVTQGSPATIAAQRATKTTPIVMTVVGDAVPQGIISSLSHPGGNVTGISWQSAELITKRLELLKEVMPNISEMAVLANANNSATNSQLKSLEVAAQSANVRLFDETVRGPNELVAAVSAIADRGIHALIIVDDGVLIANAKTLADLAAIHEIGGVGFGEFTESGGLLAYGPNRLEMCRRVAYFVDKILKGEQPADIPVEQPNKFDLTVNLKTAKALGLTIPTSVLVAATDIIE